MKIRELKTRTGTIEEISCACGWRTFRALPPVQQPVGRLAESLLAHVCREVAS